LLQTSIIAKMKKGCIRPTDSTGISVAPFWISHTEISKILQPAPIETDIRLEFVDIPNIHSYVSEHAQVFFESIAYTEDMQIFD